MGSYCRYCQHRCFILRTLRDGRTICLATCSKGMEWDRQACGQDHRTALNPVTKRRDITPDARRLAVEAGSGFTLNARISVRIITDLMDADELTAQAVACLAGVPEVYDIDTRRLVYA